MKKILPFILIPVFLLAACGSSATEAPASRDVYNSDSLAGSGGAPMMEQEIMPAPMATAGYYDDGSANSGGTDAVQVERMVIQNADLAIVVSDVEGRMKEIGKMAADMGGFVVSSNLYQSYTSDYVEVPEGSVVIRVPAEKLEEALNLIKKDVVEVQSENRSGTDVTAEYVDLKSRLKNLEAAEVQLEEIMKNATETEDVVNVFNQLVYYREQIELVKGQMKYYEEASALSAITVRIIAEATIKPLEIGGWEPKGVALEAVQDLIYFFQGFVDFIIRFVIYTLPVWIVVGVPLYFIFIGLRALFRKMRGGKKKEQAQTPEEKK